jgi:hypothetical protein
MRRLGYVVAVLLLAAPAARCKEPFRFPEAKHGKGELKYINGIPVLTVAGTPEEMGEAAGVLAVKPVKHLEALLLTFLKQKGLDKVLPIFSKSCEGMLKKMPREYLRELDAMAKASGFKRELLVILNCFIDLAKVGGCSTVVIEPGRSVNGNLLFGRNLDLPPLEELHQYSLVTVCRPKGKRAFVGVGFPGPLAGMSAINDAGLAMATNEIYSAGDGSPRFDPAGQPLFGSFRRLMEECTTVAEAEKLIGSIKHTTSISVTVCDVKTGAVLEVTPKQVGVRRAEKGLCFCTNHFQCKGLAVKNNCWRLKELEKSRERQNWTLAQLEKEMDGVNQGVCTMQTMVFEPATLTLHLALGKPPVSALPLKKMELAPLLRGK